MTLRKAIVSSALCALASTTMLIPVASAHTSLAATYQVANIAAQAAITTPVNPTFKTNVLLLNSTTLPAGTVFPAGTVLPLATTPTFPAALPVGVRGVTVATGTILLDSTKLPFNIVVPANTILLAGTKLPTGQPLPPSMPLPGDIPLPSGTR